MALTGNLQTIIRRRDGRTTWKPQDTNCLQVIKRKKSIDKNTRFPTPLQFG